MNQVTLQTSNLIERLAQAAEIDHRTAEDLLDLAVTEFLEKWATQKIADEDAVFVRQHPQFVANYLGETVAIHNGEVVDHDIDLHALHLRIRQRFGQMPILLRQVTENPNLPDLVFRSPRFVTPAS